MYAIVEIAGKQYKVQENDKLVVPRLSSQVDESVTFDRVLLVSDGDDVHVGTPVVDDASVTATVVEHFKGDKVLVFRKKRRKRFKVKRGHRQPYTRIEVSDLSVNGKKKSSGGSKTAKKTDTAKDEGAAKSAKDSSSKKEAAAAKAKTEDGEKGSKKGSAKGAAKSTGKSTKKSSSGSTKSSSGSKKGSSASKKSSSKPKKSSGASKKSSSKSKKASAKKSDDE